MTSKPVAQLLVDLNIVRSHSRPHVSNDNSYSEAAFKTLKYAPVFPDRFGSLQDARAFCEERLADYKRPRRLVIWDGPLPRNSVGKVDKKGLAAGLT